MAQPDEQNLAYLLDGKIYINLTNKCTANCIFCIKNLKDDICGANLRLKNENFTSKDVIDQLKKLVKNEKESGSRCEPESGRKQPAQGEHNDGDVRVFKENSTGAKEIIFCGYGEPTLKLDILKEVAKFIKINYNHVKVRVNTNGHANCIYKRNIIPELKGLIDEFSVSLNASTKEQYEELAQPKAPCANPFEEVKDFIKKSAEAGIETTATVVNGYKNYKINLKACEKIAHDLGAKFRIREWLDEGY